MKLDRILDVSKVTFNDFYGKNRLSKSVHWQQYFNYDLNNTKINDLINFRAIKGLSRGLDIHIDKIKTFKLLDELLNRIDKKFILNSLEDHNIGLSPTNFKYENYYVDYKTLIQIYWLNLLNENIKKEKIENICEIGGGFGSFSRILQKNFNSRVLLIDLPETNMLSTFYLSSHLPNKKFYLYDDYKKNNYLSLSDFLQSDILILPPNCNIDPLIKFNLFVNSRSMQEMEFYIIRKYFKFIQNHINVNGLFLNINRYEKDSVGYPVKISQYPYDKNWNVLYSKPSFKQENHHFLLSRRLNKNNEKSNILNELNNIDLNFYRFYKKQSLKSKLYNFIKSRFPFIAYKIYWFKNKMK